MPTGIYEHKKAPVEERFWAKVDKNGPPWNGTPCWLWQGGLNRGYGRFWVSGQMVYVHCLAYKLLIGPIPKGLTLDHLCRTPTCVNPTHLEPVPLKDNILRGVGRPAQNARATHCPNGHLYDLFNTQNTHNKQGKPRGRRCRECHRKETREYQRRVRGRRSANRGLDRGYVGAPLPLTR